MNPLFTKTRENNLKDVNRQKIREQFDLFHFFLDKF